jgi:hypothetical protein
VPETTVISSQMLWVGLGGISKKMQGVCNLKVVMQNQIIVQMNHKPKLLI